MLQAICQTSAPRDAEERFDYPGSHRASPEGYSHVWLDRYSTILHRRSGERSGTVLARDEACDLRIGDSSIRYMPLIYIDPIQPKDLGNSIPDILE